MKKIILLSFMALSISLFAGCSSKQIEVDEPKAPLEQSEENESFLTLFSSPSKSENRAWVGTFQLVFNDMKKELLKVKRVKFEGEEETLELKGLNDEEFNSDMLQESSYYTSYGNTSPKAKEKIKKDIKEKFNETSDILDRGDWSEPRIGQRKHYAYAMLKKEFSFLREFDILDEDKFNNSSDNYKYFGIDSKSNEALNNNVSVLFYNNENDYAIQLLTKEDDIIYLYRTNDKDNFKAVYEKMNKEAKNYNGEKAFQDIDTLKVPNLKFSLEKQYPFLVNKFIEGTNGMFFSLAIETLKFELDNKGGKVKSEALFMVEDNAIMLEPHDKPIPRHFNFDKTFVLFLVDKGKSNPYMALRVDHLDEYQN